MQAMSTSHVLRCKTEWAYFSRDFVTELSSIQVFQKKLPPEAVDLVSRFLQYSPNLRCTAVSLPELVCCVTWCMTWYFVGFHNSILLTGEQFFSWKPACTLSLTSWETRTLVYQMAGPCLLSSTSDLKVSYICTETAVLVFLSVVESFSPQMNITPFQTKPKHHTSD